MNGGKCDGLQLESEAFHLGGHESAGTHEIQIDGGAVGGPELSGFEVVRVPVRTSEDVFAIDLVP